MAHAWKMHGIHAATVIQSYVELPYVDRVMSWLSHVLCHHLLHLRQHTLAYRI
jgi:hypothetical protein